jgi:hypothetical protein
MSSYPTHHDVGIETGNKTSPARLAANQANAFLSTGPKTESGKGAVRLNAVKTGLTGQTVFLPWDDAALYQAHILAYEKQFRPVGPEESALVQSIADLRWRLNRLPGLEMALMSRGRLEVSALHPEYNDSDRVSMIEVHILLIYEKQFRNLHPQESRLARRRERETAELRAIQQERKALEAAQSKAVSTVAKPIVPGIGFEFSRRQFDSHLVALTHGSQEQLPQTAQVASVENIGMVKNLTA